jgi:hypothetical protein
MPPFKGKSWAAAVLPTAYYRAGGGRTIENALRSARGCRRYSV